MYEYKLLKPGLTNFTKIDLTLVLLHKHPISKNT